MKTYPRKTALGVMLGALLTALPVLAQDTMQGMDMSTPQQTTPKKTAPRKTAKPSVKHAAPAKKLPVKTPAQKTDAMPGMDMSSRDETGQDAKQAASQGDAMPGMDMSSMDMSNDKPQATMPGMDMSGSPSQGAMPGMDMPPPPQTTGAVHRLDNGEQEGVRPVVRGLGAPAMSMQGMSVSSMQGGSAPANMRSPDYSDGVGYGDMTGMDMHDDGSRGMLLVDRLEYFNGRDPSGVALDAQGWYGNDRNKLWLKADGEHSGGKLQELRTEALWDHPFATYWDTQLGVRHDFGVGPGRNWAAFGVQGLAPYWFDIEATGYVGPSGRTAARFEAQYDVLLTQRLIFQPDLEANLYGLDDRQRGIGAGLSQVDLALRLRYEFRRQFAPYIGVDLVQKFGRTADFARAEGDHAFDPRLVAGVHIWF